MLLVAVSLPGCKKVSREGVRRGSPCQSPCEFFPAADEDYFHDMDGGVALTSDEIKGRNTWIVGPRVTISSGMRFRRPVSGTWIF